MSVSSDARPPNRWLTAATAAAALAALPPRPLDSGRPFRITSETPRVSPSIASNDWAATPAVMRDASSVSWPPSPSIRYNRDEIADYLAKVRGPNSTLNYKVAPRPRGESARAVITEYTTGSSEDPKRPVRFDGSDWSLGTPTAYEARGPHDADVDPLGFVWIVYGDQSSPAYRTYGRLNPATGQLQDFKIGRAHV